MEYVQIKIQNVKIKYHTVINVINYAMKNVRNVIDKENVHHVKNINIGVHYVINLVKIVLMENAILTMENALIKN